MDRPMNNLFFRGMAVMLSIRDKFKPPDKLLQFVGVKSGDKVLDFGCGPGGYSIAAADIVGDTGKVYALDIQLLAGERMKKLAAKKGLKNIETICSGCETGLPDATLDIVLLYDILHMLSEPDKILAELYRALKPGGILSVDCHHLKGDVTVEKVYKTGLFTLKDDDGNTFNFVKAAGN